MVEDDPEILRLNERVLNRFFEGKKEIKVYKATTVKEAQSVIFGSGQELDVVLLDINMPDGSGLSLLEQIRQMTSASVIILSARNSKSDVIAGLIEGSDDYIVKPYDVDELCARVLAAFRRQQQRVSIFKNGRISLDIGVSRAYMDGVDLLLTPKQFALLLLFMKNEGRILSPEFIYQTIWKTGTTGDFAALWKQISNLKAKIETADMVHISTVRGKGYVFEISQNFYSEQG
jgi:DNA-binding response OmpR family regulator